jgi:hypothetical protein
MTIPDHAEQLTNLFNVRATAGMPLKSDDFDDWFNRVIGNTGPTPLDPGPILDMEEAYKAYLENITSREQVLRMTFDEPIEYTSRGLVAKSKLTQLRSTHPELFL